MEEPDHPKARRVGPVTVLPWVGPDQSRPRRRPGKESPRCPCWQRASSSPVGVDTHKHTHTAAVVQAVSGGVITQATVPATRPAPAVAGARRPTPRSAGGAVESSGGDGAGLTRFLQAHGEQVLELDRPSGPSAATAPSLNLLDATRAARKARGRDQLAQPGRLASARRCRCGWVARRSAVQATTDPQRQLQASWSPLPMPSATGFAA